MDDAPARQHGRRMPPRTSHGGAPSRHNQQRWEAHRTRRLHAVQPHPRPCHGTQRRRFPIPLKEASGEGALTRDTPRHAATRRDRQRHAVLAKTSHKEADCLRTPHSSNNIHTSTYVCTCVFFLAAIPYSAGWKAAEWSPSAAQTPPCVPPRNHTRPEKGSSGGGGGGQDRGHSEQAGEGEPAETGGCSGELVPHMMYIAHVYDTCVCTSTLRHHWTAAAGHHTYGCIYCFTTHDTPGKKSWNITSWIPGDGTNVEKISP